MATVNERRDSGEGDSDGIFGSEATRMFDVFLDEDAGNDAETGQPDVKTNAIAPVAARYPFGQRHNVNGFLTAQEYRQVRWIDGDATKGQWIVEVLYSGPLAGPGGALEGWTVEYDTALQTEPMIRDLDGGWVGGHAYDFLPSPQTPPPPEGRFYAKTIDGDIELVQRDPDNIVLPKTLQRFAPVSSIRASRKVENLTTIAIENAETFVGKCNSRRFLTGGPFEILVGPMRIRQHTATGAGTTTATGLMSDVELHFIKRRGGWLYERIWDYFDHKGFRGAVHGFNPETGAFEAIGRQFRVYDAGPIASMLNNFRGVTSVGGVGPIPGPVPRGVGPRP